MKKIPFVLAFVLSSSALAQETPVPPAATPTVLSSPSPVPTQEQATSLPEVVVYGRAVGLAVKELSGSEVQQVRDTGNLGPALDRQSGLETQGEGMGKAWNTLAIRGQSFRETVVLVNGQRVPESFNLGTIPTEDIEKVEVLEGPQALAYGPDALGGMINVITRKPKDQTGGLQASGGDFNSYQFQAQTPPFGDEGFLNSLGGSWFTTDGYLPPVVDSSGTTYGFTDETHWDLNHSASLKIGEDYATLSTGFFRQVGSAPDADNVIAAGTDQYDLDGRQDAWGVQSLFKAVHPMGLWQATFALSGDYSSVIRSNPIGADPTSGVYHSYLNQYLDSGEELLFSGPLDASAELTLGLDARSEGLWSGLYDDHSRWQVSLRGAGTLRLSPSLRLEWSNWLDDYLTSGPTDEPMGSLILEISPDCQVHLEAGKGYKLPTFDELYLPNTSFAALPPDLLAQFSASPFAGVWAGDKGNPALLPEQSINTETGMDLHLGAFLLQISAFADFYQDLINPQVDNSDNFWTYVNVPQAVFAGTEDSLKFQAEDWLESYFSGTWISATDQDGNLIPGRLRLKLAGGVELKTEKKWSLGMRS